MRLALRSTQFVPETTDHLSPPGLPWRASSWLHVCQGATSWQACCLSFEMAVFHFECSIHRRCASGLSVATEQIVAPTDDAAIAKAEARFAALIANRAGCATLRNDAGQIIWSTRRLDIEGSGIAMAETDKPSGVSVVPPTVPISNVNVPDPTTGSEPKSKDPVKEAESKPDDPEEAAKDGLA